MSVKNNKKIKIPLAGITKEPTTNNKTGSWKALKPVVTERCTGCGICIMFCPDDCINLVDRKKSKNSKIKKIAKIDYDYCKGCLICINQCPIKAIEKEREK